MDINEFLRQTKEFIPGLPDGMKVQETRPRAVLGDGHSLSIQAGRLLHSLPGSDEAKHYTHVDVGFPSFVDPALLSYTVGNQDPMLSVYYYVPVAVLQKVLDDHGGIVRAWDAEADTLPPNIAEYNNRMGRIADDLLMSKEFQALLNNSMNLSKALSAIENEIKGSGNSEPDIPVEFKEFLSKLE